MLENILTIIFFCSMSIPIVFIVIYCSIIIAKGIVDASEFIIDGPPEGFTIPSKMKFTDGEKQDPLPVVDIQPGSTF